jgi:hypothetical protein
MPRRCSSSAGARALEELWTELNQQPAARSARRGSRRSAVGTKADRPRRTRSAKKQLSGLLRLPLETLTEVLRYLPPAEHLHLIHVCRHLRATLLQETATSSDQTTKTSHFWRAVTAVHWRVDNGSRALHCRQLEVVLENTRFLCAQALRQALNVHYTAQRSAGRAPPCLVRVDQNSGCPAIYRTESPLSLALLLDHEGLIQGFAIFCTFRFFGPPGTDSHRDIRNYLVVKKGQRVASTGTAGPQAIRFRVCGDHSQLMQQLKSGEISAAVVQRDALVGLDPRRHSVAHALTHLDVSARSEGGSLLDNPLLLATMGHTQRLIRKSHQKTRRPWLL